MIDRGNFAEVLRIMGFTADSAGKVFTYEHDGITMSADFSSGTLVYPEKVRGRNHNTLFTAPENFVVFECVHRLITKGYDSADIELEKEWKLGHDTKGGRADICVYEKGSENVLMIIECKTAGREYSKALNDTNTDGGQLFSYWQQEISAKWLVLYTSNFADGKITHPSPAINCTDDPNLLSHNDPAIKLFVNAHTAREKFEVWQETYGSDFREDIIFSDESSAYDIGNRPILKRNLKAFDEDSKKGIINRFEEILRHNNVSDKENAFNRLVALFICKLVDEYSKNDGDELAFQYVPRRDTYEKLQDRLQKLYHEGMSAFMREEITYISAEYPREFMQQYRGGDRERAINELSEAFRKLKFFTNNDFAFLDVHNEELFYKNGKILVEVVQLFEHYRIVHTENHQLLGDMFEKLLDQGFRQNEGQFFTPIPLARFIWDCLPLKRWETWPKVIDYACGAGHFLTEAIEAVNHFIPSESREWIRDSIFGIEKDYRLSRVSKVSMFMNGAGGSNIIFGDGLEDSPDKGIRRGKFDILTANPPYSVASFKQHLRFTAKDFRLWDSISPASSEIEVLFVERIGQLLNDNGIAAVILPSSILSNDSAAYTGAREELLRTFRLRAVVKLGSKTFGATGTNTVILFLERYMRNPSRLAQVWDSTDAILDRRERDLDSWEDIDILNGYLDMQGLTREQWNDFVHERLTPETTPEYFRMYIDAYGEDFYRQAKRVEREKIMYYAFTYCQRTTVILAPSDNAGQREFLGYYWSYRKGDEGIHYDGERGGKMYVNSDREASGTLADVVRQSFGDGDIVMTEDNTRYARVVETWRMLDFSRVTFNAGINLQPQEKITDMEGKTTLAKILDVINARIETENLTPSQYVTTETMLQNCKGIMTFTGKLPNGSVYSFKPGDILLSNIRPYLQKIWLADFEGGCSTNIFVLRSKNEELYDIRYIFCMMARKDFFDYVMLNTKGLNMPQGKREHILDYVIPLPPMEIQQQIVNECAGIDSQESSLNERIKSCREKIEDIFSRLESVTERITLARVVDSVTERINTSSLSPSQYVNTDTMLQKCAGIRTYDKELPPGSVIRFQRGDILLSNIRPYLRKLWFADFDGGCSPDVLVFRSKDEEKFSGRYVYFALRRGAFFDFVMQNVKGMKMPRGKREHILDYRIPAPTQEQQKEFLDAANNLEAEISQALMSLKALEGKKEAVLKKYLR